MTKTANFEVATYQRLPAVLSSATASGATQMLLNMISPSNRLAKLSLSV